MAHTRLFSSKQRQKKLMPFATTGMEQESLILRENLTLGHTISVAPKQNPRLDPLPKTHLRLRVRSREGSALLEIVPYHQTLNQP